MVLVDPIQYFQQLHQQEEAEAPLDQVQEQEELHKQVVLEEVEPVGYQIHHQLQVAQEIHLPLVHLKEIQEEQQLHQQVHQFMVVLEEVEQVQQVELDQLQYQEKAVMVFL